MDCMFLSIFMIKNYILKKKLILLRYLYNKSYNYLFHWIKIRKKMKINTILKNINLYENIINLIRDLWDFLQTYKIRITLEI
jgi:hypothetical protein